MRRYLILSLALALTACAHDHPVAPPLTIAPPPPQRLAADLCTDPSPAPPRPAGAGLVRPATIEEQVATALLLTWFASLVDHDAELGRRAQATAASPACRG